MNWLDRLVKAAAEGDIPLYPGGLVNPSRPAPAANPALVGPGAAAAPLRKINPAAQNQAPVQGHSAQPQPIKKIGPGLIPQGLINQGHTGGAGSWSIGLRQ